MQITPIQNGIVLDHIKAGQGMKLYKILGLCDLDCAVAVITNVGSRKMGRKDIIKIDSVIDLNLDIIGYFDPNITVNVITDGVLDKRPSLALPAEIRGFVKCRNPRCITTTEQEIVHIFTLTDREKGSYRCLYCGSLDDGKDNR